MIRYTTGNMLDAQAEAVVNTVNTFGVMGKGIALQFKEAYPENYDDYKAACDAKQVVVGKMFVTQNHALTGPRWIINFPTKQHWRHPSKMQFITAGLQDLRRVLTEKGIKSVALPPLGCGNGGLNWSEVRPEIESALADLPGIDVIVYQPTTAYQNTPKESGVENLTPARAMLVEIVRRYLAIGFECSNLEVQKLAWFLQRFIEAFRLTNPLRLNFEANKFGPYADNLRQLLNTLDGSYLHCAKRLADAGPMEPITVDHQRLPRVKEFMASDDAAVYQKALAAAERLIDGFETPFLMELLSTVDWIQHSEGRVLNTPEITAAMAKWPGGKPAAQRKSRLFDAESVELARGRLAEFQEILYRN
jgi:O-acetyl-ADP-ribose deacetylase (regulator of RNase III)